MISYKGFQITGEAGAYGWQAPERFAGVTCGPVFTHKSEAESSIDSYIAAQGPEPEPERDGMGNRLDGAGEYCPACGQHASEACDCDAPRDYEPEEFKGPWSVAVFKIDKAYGGPEEGGWYYGVGEPVIAPGWPLPSFHATREAAIAAREAMDSEIEKLGLNEGLPSIDSVLSQGRYAAHVCEGMPTHYPKERPYYE